MEIDTFIDKGSFFLLGHYLPYSLSPLIHNKISQRLNGQSFNYQICETYNSENEKAFARDIILNYPYIGINVTNPHKKLAFELCDTLDNICLETGVCNTLVKRDDKIYGYNTDYYGVIETLKRFNFQILGKKILILGNGATSNTVRKAVEYLGAKEVINLVRNKKNDFEDYLINYNKYSDFNYIINCTPYGTSPEFKFEPFFSLKEFDKLEGVFDCIYNPSNTPLTEEAKKYNIKAVNGLYMLVSQAVYSEYLFHNAIFDNSISYICEDVYKEMLIQTTNIVLIGMPYCGKSYFGNVLNKLTNKKVFDSDTILANDYNSLQEVMGRGETLNDYRKYESEVIKKLSAERGIIISTGGGVPTVSINNQYLKLNSVIVFINENLEVLISRIDNSRPLVKEVDDLIELYNQRIDTYLNVCDLIINSSLNNEEIIKKIEEVVYENISY